MRHIDDIAAKVRRAERIDDAEAARLWREAPLWLLGELATAAKQRVSGDKVYYNRNFHIEPTNRCVFNCRFCSYRRPAGAPEAWDYTMDEIEQIARERQGKGITEVHIVGGVHPDHGLDYYTDMIRRVKAILPGAAVKAFTAIELSYMIRKAGLTTEDVVKTTVFITDIADFAKVNAIYAQTFSSLPPARSCVEVSALPSGALVEIEIVAAR